MSYAVMSWVVTKRYNDDANIGHLVTANIWLPDFVCLVCCIYISLILDHFIQAVI